jgi:hypothetical protein
MSKYYPWKSFHAATTQVLTATTTAATLTNLTTTYAGAVNAVIEPVNAAIRYAYGGYTPLALTGCYLSHRERITLEGPDEMRYFKFRRAGTTSTPVMVTYKFPDDAHSRK